VITDEEGFVWPVEVLGRDADAKEVEAKKVRRECT